MLDTFLKLLDRLIALLKERERKRDEYFSVILQPLHTEFELIVKNYLSFFRDFLNALERDEHWVDQLATLKRQREHMRSERVALRARIDALMNDFDDRKNLPSTYWYLIEVREFFDLKAGFDFVDQREFPSLAGLFKEVAEERACVLAEVPHASWSGLLLELFDFLRFQDEHFENPELAECKHELMAFVALMIQSFEIHLGNATRSFTSLQVEFLK